MKRFVVAFAGLVALASAAAAAAADLSPRYQQPYAKAPVYAPGFSWAGFYLGINGGGGWGRSEWTGVDKFNISGAMIGGTVGYNWQINQFVLGVEGDIDWTGMKGQTNVLCAPGCETRNHWLSTVRGRAGYAFDRILPYVTAGLAVGDVSANVPGFPGGSVTSAGWTIGAGLEWAVIGNVSVKAEYLFVSLSDFNCGFNCGLVGNGNVSFYDNIGRVGLNVHF